MGKDKKNKNSKKVLKDFNSTSGDNDELYNMFKIVLILVCIFGVLYFVFAIVNGEISFNKKTERNVEIHNVEILAGNTFNRSEEEYYVLYFDFKDENSAKYNSIFSSYSTDNKIFIVDLGNAFNKGYVTLNKDEVNTNNIEELKVVDGTLIKVNNKVASLTVIGAEEIKAHFENK